MNFKSGRKADRFLEYEEFYYLFLCTHKNITIQKESYTLLYSAIKNYDAHIMLNCLLKIYLRNIIIYLFENNIQKLFFVFLYISKISLYIASKTF